VADLANLRISVDSREVKTATSDLNKLSRASGDAEQKTNGLGRAFGGLRGVLAGLGFGLLARELIVMADTFTNMQSQIRLVTSSTEELTAVQTRLFQMAQNSRVSYEGTVDLYARLARSTKALGVSQESILTVTDSINKALLVSGTSSAQASGSLMQLGQAFASGALRGDELNSVMEGMPRVATMIAEGMGISVGELKKLGEQGKLTGAEVFNAIMKMKDSVEVEAAKMPMTFGQSMTVLRNSLIQFVGSANETLGITRNLAALIALLANNLDVLAVAVGTAGAAFVALKASMAVSFVVSYIRSVIGLQMALGATGTASAIFSAGLKMIEGAFRSLTATMMLNPFVAVASAIVAVTTLLYANRDAQVQVAGQTVRFGDIFLGVFELIKQGVAFVTKIFREGWAAAIGSVAPNLAWLGGIFSKVFSAIGGFIKSWINTQIGFFAGLWAAVTAIFKGEDITDAFGAAFKKDYVGGFVKQVGNGIVSLANLGAQANKTSKAAVSLGEQGMATATAAMGKTAKKTKEATDELKKYRDALADMVVEGKKIGMTPEQAKAFDVEALADEAEAVAKANKLNIGTLADRIRQQGMLNALNEYSAGIQKKVSDELKDYAKSIVEANKEHKNTMTTLKGEATLIGLVGVEREKASLALEREAYVLKHGVTAWEEYYAARLAGIDKQSVFDKDIEALQTLTNNLETAAGMIGGKGGRALQGALKMELVLADGTTEKLSQTLAKSFKGLSDILAQAVAGMQIGNLVGGAAGSKTGGTIGGGIGGALGKKLLTGGLEKIMPQLGQFAGPLGALAGGLLGGVIGGLLKKTKTGSVTLNQIAGGAMERTLTGNSAQLKDIANNMANGLLKGVGNIAEQLGGTLGGNVKVSLGMRKKDFVVDPTGGGRTKGAGVKNFGTDEAAAVAYVTQLAIQQGIVTGISAGAQTLIRAGNDLNEQVQKALKFDQVFKDLVNESDPLRASLDELSVEMEKLKAIFAEAGASAADYAKLEELYAIKQAKATFEANRPRRELEIQLMEAQGRSVEALAASRQLELEAMDEGLRGIQRQIFAQQDLNAANEAVAAAEARVADARRAQREREIESMRAQIDGLDTIIARREDAQAALRQAYDAEISRIDAEISKRNDNIASLEDAYSSQASIIQGTIDQFRDFASSLRDFASSIIPMNGSGPQSLEALRRRFADITRAALGGDTTAMGQVAGAGGELRESIMANATDRTSMLRQLFALQNQTLEFANQADQQASIGQQQLTTLRAQYDVMIAAEQSAIANYEAQKLALTAQVEQFITLNEKVLSVDEAIRQLQSAEQAAIEAEGQKATLLAQIDALLALDQTVIDLTGAERELADAQAQRDNLLMEINRNGLAAIAYETRLVAANIAASTAATKAAAAAAAALPNNVIPFPIMGGSSGAGGGFGGGGGEFGSNNNILPFANGGIHSGGLRIVGENGPELEATGPSRIYNANQLNDMMGSVGTAEEVKGLREELKLAVYQIAKNTGKSYNLMNRWDGNGLPDIREDASDYY
jgi:tape measure domain-containing protein